MSAITEKQIKAAVKEGGKKGVDLAGIKETGGSVFFTLCMNECHGSTELLVKCLEGANKPVDEAEEERKGGAGDIAKTFVSMVEKENKIACAVNVPACLAEKMPIQKWVDVIIASVPDCEVTQEAHSDEIVFVIVKCIPGKSFPLKVRDEIVNRSHQFLVAEGLSIASNDDEEDTGDFGLDW